jgi:hypothetical protein
MKAIPKVIHIIWIGGDLPQRNRDCISTFVRHNPHWKINLWIDANQLLTGERRRQVVAKHNGNVSADEWQRVAKQVNAGGDAATIRYLDMYLNMRGEELRGLRLKQATSIVDFCSSKRITLCEVQRDLKMGKNAAIYRQELVNRGANFGSASDILRIEILLQHGGIYVDTDIECVSALGDIICHQSYPRFSAVSPHWANGVSEENWTSDAWWLQNFKNQMAPKISNSIIACHPRSKGLKSYKELINSNFTKMRRDDEMRSDYFERIRNSTIKMTGPTAAAKSTGFSRVRGTSDERGSEAVPDDFSDQRKLDLRDHWYFPMYYVRDLYFHDWL